MAALIIQIDARHGRAAAMHRSSGKVMSVGRGFINDVVLLDPYVDPEQVKFQWVDDRWNMMVIDNTNPVFLNGLQLEEGTCLFHSGDRLVIGRTHITLFMEDHEVHGTRKLLLTKGIRPASIRPTVALIMVAVMCFIIGVSEFQELSKVFKLKLIYPEVLTTTIILVVWSGAWALAGRLLKHEQHFFPQIFFTSLIYTVLVFLDPVASYLEYAINSRTLGMVLEWGLSLVFLTAMLKINLSLATNLKSTTAAALMVSTSVLLASYSAINYTKDNFDYVPEYSKVLKPPFAKISQDQTPGEFFSETDNLFTKLKEAINEEAKKN